MDATTLKDFLEQQDACEEARDWQRGKHLEEAWQQCGRGDWMVWLVCRAVNRRKLVALQHTLVLVAVELAENVQHLVPADEERPRAALALGRQWLAGEDVSLQQLEEAAEAADAADAVNAQAAEAAKAAAWAAYWGAAWDAVGEADWSARTALAARWAFRAAFWAATAAPELQAKQADIVRKHLPYETIAPLFNT